MVEVLVEFDYEAEQEDELTIRVGQVIKNVIMSEGGWWEGELNGKKGMFPDNFVKVKERVEKKKEDPKKDLLVQQQRSSVKELANRLKDVHVGSAPQKKKDPPHPVHSEKKKKAKVMFDYEPENDDELKIEVGDIVEVIKQEEEGWWEGILNGKTGVFPSNFVELLDSDVTENIENQPPPVEEKPKDPEIKGKKIMGVGLGNIFEGGPIKLRTTGGGSSKKTSESNSVLPTIKKEQRSSLHQDELPQQKSSVVDHQISSQQKSSVGDQKVSSEPVIKREKPVSHFISAPTPARRKSKVIIPIPTPRRYIPWSSRDNGDSPFTQRDFQSLDHLDDKTNIFHHAYNNDTEPLKIRHLFQQRDPCISISSHNVKSSKICGNLSKRLLSDCSNVSDSDSLEDSNKENLTRDCSDENLEYFLSSSSRNGAGDIESETRNEVSQWTTSQENVNAMASQWMTAHEKMNATLNKPCGIECDNIQASRNKPKSKVYSKFKNPVYYYSNRGKIDLVSRSDISCDREFHSPLPSAYIQKEAGSCESAPGLYERKEQLPGFRKPLRPIAIHNLADADLHVNPYFPKKNFTTPEFDLPSTRSKESYGDTDPREKAAKRSSIAKEGYLYSLRESGNLSPFVSSVANKYHLLDWRDRRWKKYVDIQDGIASSRTGSFVKDQKVLKDRSKVEKNMDNSALQDELSSVAIFFEKTPEVYPFIKIKSHQEFATRGKEPGRNFSEYSLPESKDTSFESLSKRYRQYNKVLPLFIMAAEVYKKNLILQRQSSKTEASDRNQTKRTCQESGLNFERMSIGSKGDCSEEGMSKGENCCSDYLQDTFSGNSNFEEEELLSSLEGLERYLQSCVEESDMSTTDCNHHPWVSPQPKYISKYKVENGYFNEHLLHNYNGFQKKQGPDQCLHNFQKKQGSDSRSDDNLNLSQNEETQTSDVELDNIHRDDIYRNGRYHSEKRDASTSPITALLSYDTSFDNSKEYETPEWTPAKIKCKPRYSSSPVIKSPDSGDYDIEGNAENGMDLEIVGKKIKLDDTYKGVEVSSGCDYNLSENVSQKKRKLSWKKLFRPKQKEPVRLLSFKRKSDGHIKPEDISDLSIMSENNKENTPSIQCNNFEKRNLHIVTCHVIRNEFFDSQPYVVYDTEQMNGTVETIFCHDFSDDDSVKFEQKLNSKTAPNEVLKYSLNDIVSELGEEGKIESDAQKVEHEEKNSKLLTPHSLMYLAGMACGKKYQTKTVDKIVENDDDGEICPDLQGLVSSSCKYQTKVVDKISEQSNDTVDDEICPDSPGLIASMSQDVCNLNLTQSPLSSDTEMSKHLDSFLRDALKPIDDLTLQNDSSEEESFEENIKMTSFSEDISELKEKEKSMVNNRAGSQYESVTGTVRRQDEYVVANNFILQDEDMPRSNIRLQDEASHYLSPVFYSRRRTTDISDMTEENIHIEHSTTQDDQLTVNKDQFNSICCLSPEFRLAPDISNVSEERNHDEKLGESYCYTHYEHLDIGGDKEKTTMPYHTQETISPTLIQHSQEEKIDRKDGDRQEEVENDGKSEKSSSIICEDQLNYWEENTNNNYQIVFPKAFERYPKFSLMPMSPLMELGEEKSGVKRSEADDSYHRYGIQPSPSDTYSVDTTGGSEKRCEADDSYLGYGVQPSRSDTRSVDTTGGSEKFYTDLDTDIDNTMDNAKFYTDVDTDLDSTMENSTPGRHYRQPRYNSHNSVDNSGLHCRGRGYSSHSPIDNNENINWGQDDSVEV